MRATRSAAPACLLLLLALALTRGAAGAAPPLKDSDCLDCHSDKTLSATNAAGKEVSLFVDKARLAASAHKTNTCASCHADITSKHPDDNRTAQAVRCAACHERQTESYGASVHGLALKAGRDRIGALDFAYKGLALPEPDESRHESHWAIDKLKEFIKVNSYSK